MVMCVCVCVAAFILFYFTCADGSRVFMRPANSPVRHEQMTVICLNVCIFVTCDYRCQYLQLPKPIHKVYQVSCIIPDGC